MLRLLSLLIFLALAALCIWLAVANREPVTVVLEPLIIAQMPLFFVFFAGVFAGCVAIGMIGGLKRLGIKRHLSKAQKRVNALEAERDALAAERDGLAEQVRPDDARFDAAQTIEAPRAGSLTGPTHQTVIPG